MQIAVGPEYQSWATFPLFVVTIIRGRETVGREVGALSLSSGMTDTESIRAKLENPATNLADLAQISTILRNTTEAEKHRAEIAESKNKSEALRFWIPILAPTIS